MILLRIALLCGHDQRSMPAVRAEDQLVPPNHVEALALHGSFQRKLAFITPLSCRGDRPLPAERKFDYGGLLGRSAHGSPRPSCQDVAARP
jgi:hypothetical protein